jgi:hypothetical protein
MSNRIKYAIVGLLALSILATAVLMLNIFVTWLPTITAERVLEIYNNQIAIYGTLSAVLQLIVIVTLLLHRPTRT